MTREEMYNKILDLSKKVVGLCSDKERASQLLSEMNSMTEMYIKEEIGSRDDGGKSARPVHFCIDNADVVDIKDMGTCMAVKTTTGYGWVVKGGYRIYVDENVKSLSSAIQTFFDNIDSEQELSKDELEKAMAVTSVVTNILNLPMVAFTDAEFAVSVANKMVTWMNDNYKKSVNQPLQPDDNPKETRDFQEAVVASEELKDNL